ncbi:MAG: hypothetical protein QOF16_1124 [Actinomycetota bacterium]|jgi:hypothetical protein|nr:hypothetical protein [Actinomycetota bacterium]
MAHLHITEPAETEIEEPTGSLEQLETEQPAVVAARFPACLAAWARLGDQALTDGRTIEAYAFYRVGYHRGLDRIRKAGWRGSGTVPWSHEANRGFLRSLKGLSDAAGAIGETAEQERCIEFYRRLAPDAP